MIENSIPQNFAVQTSSLMFCANISHRQCGGTEVHLNPQGTGFSHNQKVKLALGSTHTECYLLVIVVVILCPVWQCINEQHANTFCWNICDRHIFRLSSKEEKKKKTERNVLSPACTPVCKQISQLLENILKHFPLTLSFLTILFFYFFFLYLYHRSGRNTGDFEFSGYVYSAL